MSRTSQLALADTASGAGSDAVPDRDALLLRRDRRAICEYFGEALEHKSAAIVERRRLGKSFLNACRDRDPGEAIPRETGLGRLQLGDLPLARQAMDEARALIAARLDAPLRSKGSLAFHADGSDFDKDSAAVRLAACAEVLAPVIRYFGVLPILHQILVTRPIATRFLPGTTHQFHANPVDATLIKVFVHLSEVDEGCGPLHVLDAALSRQVDEALDFPRGRISDEDVEQVIGPGRAPAQLGPAGTAVFCDTARCLHFGGRPPQPGKPPRDLLVICYMLPTSALYPRFPGDGEAPKGMSRLRPKRDSPLWNAFIGAELV